MATFLANEINSTGGDITGRTANVRIMFPLERFSFECRKVIGFAFTTLRDWLNFDWFTVLSVFFVIG